MFVHATRAGPSTQPRAPPNRQRRKDQRGTRTVQDLGRCGLAYPCPVSRRRLTIGLAVVVGVVVLALIAGTAFVFWSVRRPFPEYDGAVTLPALAGEVEVVRDEHGIPHIYADTAEDLFRAQGYVHAQDRFWQMDFRRHVTAGRLSELFGEDQVETDVFVRTLGWRRVAEQELPLLSPATRRYLEAYAEGVNGWLAGRSGGELGFAYTLLGLTGGDNAPEPWRPVDSLAWLKAMAWDLRGNMEDEIDRALLAAELPVDRIEQLYPAYPYEQNAPIVDDAYLSGGQLSAALADHDVDPAQALPEAATAALRDASKAASEVPDLLGEGPGVGSNSWVVDGSRTASGAPPAGQRPAPRSRHAVDLVPGRSALPRGERRVPVRGRWFLLLRRARRGDRAQRPDRLGVYQPQP